MQSGCNLIYPPSMWKKVLKSLDSKDEDYERYMFYLQQNFVSENRDLRWCPAPGCTWISQRKGFDTSVICKCGRGYCFACGDEIHTPVTCEILKKWYARIEDQKDSGDVYLSTLKPCPKCTVLLDKDGGCNHMTCKSCRYEFCWICMGPWKQHGQETGGYYSCNRPVDESLLGESKNAKQRLDYFEHYHTRFVEHGNSQRFSQNQLKSISSKIQKFNSLNACAENVGEFIREGVEVVAECRRILKYTYAWGFFMEKGPQKDLFEFLQRDLEAETERLSELTEEPVEKIDRLIHLEYIKSSKKYLINLLDGLSDFQGKA
ncbi:putative ubiquitin-conjugating enzyme E2-binding protein 1 [Monocercomonoides exilis]|uniref:putative ubiquitin-conjugating enzyme E2-binding protein 1 n=1 Tax=Monocercomonoides exilis TaxID=2049356 RepID=UPI00355AA67A|nr:putative ubiquitin-conjugating enzyme E2-binding protein 1 [Monocercomonoides exilis]|eukprot:MONOS_3817.1-p1 / transcript=MONOS_3817.1 / gene=MONOS_3817 / organism=Monocercomonoides_exilis_PA203 / gene_product=ubiquitin-conjugating enzyme E2-binding protein 1 / transcript_product=ubiquitin-conjugating enzyme E2-binding protein 1 / location=Mono_scaffold00093:114877-116896(-) / protein_length=317 / sequence_SO=supercontig / SO=protein_coding / is_pseudo=false